MKVEIKKEDKNRLEFLLSGATQPFANVVRRFAMNNVPVFAIDTVTFYENSSSLFDEYIAHRLGQLPILSEEGRAKEEVIFTLEAEGPAMIYSGNLKSSDSKIKCAIGSIPIIRLLDRQSIRLEAKARLGTGKKHAKFQPGMLSYEILSSDEFNFKVETFMQLEPHTLLSKTAEKIEEACDELEEKIKSIGKE